MYKYITHTSCIHHTTQQPSHTQKHTQSSENFFLDLQSKLKHCYCSLEIQGKVKKIILVGGKQELQSQAYMYELHIEGHTTAVLGVPQFLPLRLPLLLWPPLPLLPPASPPDLQLPRTVK